jgi:hypothetical protein
MQTDPEAFFPANKAYADEYNGYNNYNEARKICAECPAKGECLADALMTGDVTNNINPSRERNK